MARSDLRLSIRDPQPENLQLVIEIADTTLAFDLSTKARLYARAGIIEYWVLDLPGRRIIVHRAPRDGAYSSVVAYRETEFVSPLAARDAKLQVGDVLPPGNAG
jgi:Uma2 family endonuclease